MGLRKRFRSCHTHVSIVQILFESTFSLLPPYFNFFVILKVSPHSYPGLSGTKASLINRNSILIQQDCPKGSLDFRALQCSNTHARTVTAGSKSYRITQWVPKYTGGKSVVTFLPGFPFLPVIQSLEAAT